VDVIKNNPKIGKLSEILSEHFAFAAKHEESTRVIVFSQWRESVDEIVGHLRTLPMVKPHAFVGQGKTSVGAAGMKQDEQQEVIKGFRRGKYNVLVCTCIGEEGLDIGEVDLIVNVDTLTSPVRMTQRAGRTGRKRDGKVVCLIMAGAEKERYDRNASKAKMLNRQLVNGKYKFFPDQYALFPPDFKPAMFEERMEPSQEYGLSQIGGHRGKPKKARRSQGVKSDWRLTLSQEKVRARAERREERRGEESGLLRPA
jgi:ERCC4-related helicase